MSKVCKGCGAQNGDERIFCSCCGEPLDAELRFRMAMDQYQKDHKDKGQSPTSMRDSSNRGKRQEIDDEDEMMPIRMAEQKKSAKTPWIILGLLIAAAAISLSSVDGEDGQWSRRPD